MQVIRKNWKQGFLLMVTASQWSAHFLLRIYSFNTNLLEEFHTWRLKIKADLILCEFNKIKWKVLWKSLQIVILFRLKWKLYNWALELLRNYLIAELSMMCYGTRLPQDIKIKAFAFPSTLCEVTWRKENGEERGAVFCPCLCKDVCNLSSGLHWKLFNPPLQQEGFS